jgi:DNA-binding NtrC family response regulator
VRELRNLIERSLILGSLNVSALYPGGQREVGAAAAGPGGAPGSRAAPTTDLQTLERQHIQGVLASVDGDKTEAARLLGISRRTLERRVADWAQES